MTPSILLDRDGVVIEDVHLLSQPTDLRILPGVPEALTRLKQAGFFLALITNQPVVARGLTTEAGVAAVHHRLQELLEQAGAPRLDAIYFCPHHPQATLPVYRVDCECRKPRPGLLLRAATEHDLDLNSSFAVGDRITDIIAGAKAGCRTVLVQSGKHLERAIETSDRLDTAIQPEHVCADLKAAVEWIWKTR